MADSPERRNGGFPARWVRMATGNAAEPGQGAGPVLRSLRPARSLRKDFPQGIAGSLDHIVVIVVQAGHQAEGKIRSLKTRG